MSFFDGRNSELLYTLRNRSCFFWNSLDQTGGNRLTRVFQSTSISSDVIFDNRLATVSSNWLILTDAVWLGVSTRNVLATKKVVDLCCVVRYIVGCKMNSRSSTTKRNSSTNKDVRELKDWFLLLDKYQMGHPSRRKDDSQKWGKWW